MSEESSKEIIESMKEKEAVAEEEPIFEERKEEEKSTPSHCLSIKEIWAADDLRIEKVEVPEWGGHVFIKSLTGEERDHFESTIFEKKGEDTKTNFENLRAKLLVMSVVDVDGNKIFRPENVKRLGTKSSRVLDRLFTVAQRLSGLRKEDIDEMTKN